MSSLIPPATFAIFRIINEYVMRNVIPKDQFYDILNGLYDNIAVVLKQPNDLESKQILLRPFHIDTPIDYGPIKDVCELTLYSFLDTHISKLKLTMNTIPKILERYKETMSVKLTSTDPLGKTIEQLPEVSLDSLMSIVLAHIAPGVQLTILYDLIGKTFDLYVWMQAFVIYLYVNPNILDMNSRVLTASIVLSAFNGQPYSLNQLLQEQVLIGNLQVFGVLRRADNMIPHDIAMPIPNCGGQFKMPLNVDPNHV